jgi:hypothetical protein
MRRESSVFISFKLMPLLVGTKLFSELRALLCSNAGASKLAQKIHKIY